MVFKAGKSNSFSVYTRFFFLRWSSGAVRGLAFISLGGGRLTLDFETRDEDPDDFPLLPAPPDFDVLPAEGLVGAIIEVVLCNRWYQ
jgi:hypothetical protein